jgi:hypothetical protein
LESRLTVGNEMSFAIMSMLRVPGRAKVFCTVETSMLSKTSIGARLHAVNVGAP